MKFAHIKIDGQIGKIIDSSRYLPIQDMKDVCSYMPPAADFIKRRVLEKKRKQGDDKPTFNKEILRTCLFNEISLTFPAGLKNSIKEVLDMNGFEVEDKSTFTTVVDPNWVGEQFPEPWQHQKEIFDLITRQRRGIIKSPTASGKTLMGCWVWGNWNAPLCIVTAPTTMIADQWVEAINTYYPKKTIGKWYSKHKSKIGAINVMTPSMMQSIIQNEKKLGHKLIQKVKMCIVDECHSVGSGKYGKPNKTYLALMHLKNVEVVYGFSATALMRSDKADLFQVAAIGNLIKEIDPSVLIAREVLAIPNIIFVPIPEVSVRWKKKEESNLEYYRYLHNTAIVNNEIRNMKAMNLAINLKKEGRQVLIITNTVEHIDNLLALDMAQKENKIAGTHGEDPNKGNKVQMFLDGFCKILVCTYKLMGLGVNIPQISGIVYVGGDRSKTKSTQWVGRGLRKYMGKLDCKIYDFADGTGKLSNHSLMRAKTWIELGYNVDVSNVSWMKRLLYE